MLMNRRKLLGGLSTLIAAPAIIRVADLMPVKAIPATLPGSWLTVHDEEGWHSLTSAARLTIPQGVTRVRAAGTINGHTVQTSLVQVSGGDYFDLYGSEQSLEIRKNGSPYAVSVWIN